MRPTPTGVELLARSLAYTRVVLAGVGDADLTRPTPCAAWTLADLLVHLDDGLDAFAEAAAGRVWLVPASPALLGAGGPGPPPSADAAGRVAGLQAKACALHAAWAADPAATVLVGGVRVAAATLARSAALEVAVHGNDVARSVRATLDPALRALPPALARDLTPVAAELVGPDDRAGGRFGPVRAVARDAGPGPRLLARLGRDPD